MRRRAVASRVLLGAFLIAAVVDLGSLLVGAEAGHLAAKPLLMPLLAAYAAARRAPASLVAALLFGWGGDVLLLGDADGAFLAGMGCFAAGHVCYLLLFGRRSTSPALGLLYAGVLAVTVLALWPDLPAGLRVPVAAYSLLLTAVAYRSSSLGLLAGAGGALFLLSDTLIATALADWPQPPFPDFWVMATYLAAQFLLTEGTLRARYGECRTTSRTTSRTAI
ncbi:lysoplasmalogenase family protein [Streptomyces sp. NPDC048604]|uniref:lysoplasmalogenase family protein n=1 Tax=Streptomyces sp. NPDC048604 TaxID=3365578 RepID=UPI00371A8DC3